MRSGQPGTASEGFVFWEVRTTFWLFGFWRGRTSSSDEDQPLPSLAILLAQVAAERETMNAHAESLDSKTGVVLGFAGVLVGPGLPHRSLSREV
jgi:hypothetical protein